MLLVGFKPDLDDQLVSFSALTLLVWLVIWPVKIVPEMTSKVLSGTLSLYSTATTGISVSRLPRPQALPQVRIHGVATVLQGGSK